MKPLEWCIYQHKSAAKFADSIGVTRQLVYRWKKPYINEAGGVRGAHGGNVPQKYWDRIVEHAEKNGLDISRNDLLNGRN